MSGILPRTGEFLFKEIKWLAKNGFKCSIEAACFEIYCEEIKDLFDKQSTNWKDTKDLNWVAVSEESALSGLIHQAHQNRTFEKTAHNDRSSRSHAVFQIWVTSLVDWSKKKVSMLNIIDLAGSERWPNMSKSKSSGNLNMAKQDTEE